MPATGQNAFNLEMAVFLEGVQVPCSSATVSYGIGTPPTCTIVLPASNIIRDLPEHTKMHVFFKDLLPDPNDNLYKWRLLFDGEYSGWSYSTDANGATMTLSGLHSTGFLNLMQLMTLDAAEYAFNPQQKLMGQATIPIAFGQSRINSKLIKNIVETQGFESMSGIVYALLYSILCETGASPTGQYYQSKMGDVAGGWKLLSRMYGVTDKDRETAKAVAAKPIERTQAELFKQQPGVSSTSAAGTTPSHGTGRSSSYYVDSDFISSGDPYGSSSFPGMDSQLIEYLDNLTDAINNYGGRAKGTKLGINSGYRSQAYNDSLRDIGSAPKSYHIKGMAVDIDAESCGLSVQQLSDLAINAGFRGTIMYDWGVHCDVRDQEYHA